MIVKKMKRTNFSKSKAVMISELVDYIFAPHDELGREKLAHYGTLNFLTTTRAAQKNEMIALAEESIQSRMPVTHWVLSWKDAEQPTPDQLDFAVEYFLRRMELEGHQTLYVQHKNTVNTHVHIVVNRVNPDTLKVRRPNHGFDIDLAHIAIAEIEHIQGWQSEENRVFRQSRAGAFWEKTTRDTPNVCSRAESRENATGEKSAQRIAQERGRTIIKEATSWGELHAGLADVGLRFEKKGSGALIWVGDVAVKASSVDRAFSLPKLVKRLGTFEAGEYPEEKATLRPEPMPPIKTMFAEEWQEYQRERELEKKKRALILKQKKDTLQRWEEERKARRENSLRRLSRYGLPMMNIGRHFLKEQLRQENRKRQQAQAVLPSQQPLQRTFRLWLMQKDMRKSALWRHRRKIRPDAPIAKFSFTKAYETSLVYEEYRKKAEQELGNGIDGSMIDATVAMRMRLDGHAKGDAINAIYRNSPWAAERSTREDKIEYVQTIARVSYGALGDVTIARMQAEEVRRKRQTTRWEKDEEYSLSFKK